MASLPTLDDGEFWLPPQFLDDDFFVDKNAFNTSSNNNSKASFSPFDFPYASDLNSPVESIGCSDSTESEEEDIFVAGLANKLAHSTLGDDFPSLDKPTKGWAISTSPQSTLCSYGCGCKRVSPNGDSEAATWDLLYAAAGEVARLRLNQQLHASYNSNNSYTRNGHNGYLAPSKHSPISPPLNNNNNNNNNNHHSHLALYQKLQTSQFHLRQQQMMKRPQHYHSHAPLSHNRLPTSNTAANHKSAPLPLSPNAWPPLTQTQTQTGSAMRAVFLGNPQTKRECAGTGVFLPRRVTEPRKKQACSTVLLPAKVVHALNLNMDSVGPTRVPQPHHPRFNYGEKRMIKPQQVNLPSEWTY